MGRQDSPLFSGSSEQLTACERELVATDNAKPDFENRITYAGPDNKPFNERLWEQILMYGIPKDSTLVPAMNNRESIRKVFLFALFVSSTVIMGLSKNPVFIGIWVALWVVTKKYKTPSKGMDCLIFFVMFYLFYSPTTSTSPDSYYYIHDLYVILSCLLAAFIILYSESIPMVLNEFPTAKAIFYCWLLWGAFAYAPVFFSTVWRDSFLSQLNIIPQLNRDNTGLKTAIPVLASVGLIILPAYALKTVEDFRRFWKLLSIGTIVYCLLSLLRYALNIDFIPQEYGEVRQMGYRLTGFVHPDANYLGRMLLMPIILSLSVALTSPRTSKALTWTVLVFGIICTAMTYSRTTFISLSSSLVLLFMAVKQKLAGIALFSIIFFLVAIIAWQYDLISYFGYGEGSDLTNLYSRQMIYRWVLDIIADNPWFGAYPGGYEHAILSVGFGFEKVVSAHNMTLAIAVEWGIPMAIVLVATLIFSIYHSVKTITSLSARTKTEDDYFIQAFACATLAVAAAYLVHGLTEIVPPYYVFFNFGLALASHHYANRVVPARGEASI
jgi:O-antigen ligase